MIQNEQIRLINENENEIKLEWEWTDSDGEINVYLQKFQDDKLERLGTIVQIGGLAYADKVYKMKNKGLYRIVIFPVIKGVEDESQKKETDYICLGGKNNLEYYFEDAEDLNCRCLVIKRVDRAIPKNLAYLVSSSDNTKIPLTADLTSGQIFYISSYADFNLELKYPYSEEVEKRRTV